MDEQDKGSFDPLGDQPMQPAPADAPPKSEQDYAESSRRAGSYMATLPAGPKEPLDEPEKSDHHNLIISFIAIICLALIAGGIYWYSLKKPKAAPAASHTSSVTATQATSQIDSQTKNYNSPNFNLAFNYPADWTISDEGGGFMTAKSPTITLKDPSGASFNGQIVLTIQSKGAKLSQFNAGNATAVLDSQKIAYTQPTQTQRANTYLSFLQYASTTAHGALDAIYITGDLGYQKGQAIPLTDVQQIDPLITLSFVNSAAKPASVAGTMWDDASFSGPLTKLFESFSIN